MKTTQLSPCILSWARYALGIKQQKAKNTKTCSKDYWIKTINYLLLKHTNKETNRLRAIDLFEDCVKRKSK
ncbi:hypothetical protein [Winogradskyella sp. Asnod2-B02-A]|uniref:hypothetical protein n=1 Tax=Winogradskyella sp. Asnod2-B02-A TaxID=3160583 RepID=UPI00386397BC